VERALTTTTTTTTTWFDEKDRLTLEKLQTATFPLSRLGRRGYEEEPVKNLLRTVHAEFLRLVNERASLWQEVQRLRRRVMSGGADGGPQEVLFGKEDAHIHAVRILSTAQVTADRYVADAQAYSSRLTEEARLRRDHIMREAHQHSDMILEDAHARAREAAVSALSAPVPPQTNDERHAAHAELAYLRTYGDVYRAHLRAYTESVLRGIEDWERRERKETASLEETSQWHANGGSMGHRSDGPAQHSGPGLG
jgi:cell division septum initiation protein DivIVA